jgi:putative ABC transport system permease protein
VYFAQNGFVKTLGLQLVEGRDFNEGEIIEKNDAAEGWSDNFPKGVIVSRALAKVLFPTATSYAGKTFYFGSLENSLPVRVLGVVDHLQTTGAQTGNPGEYSVIIPWRISLDYSRYAIRAQPGQIDRVLAAAQDAIRKLSATPTRTFTRTVLEDRKTRYRAEHAVSWMLVAVSALLLLVTASGIVGMTSLRVAQRRKQIGVRRALGARWRDIVRYFVTENLLITTGGIAVGVVLTIALNQFLVRQLELGHLPGMYMVAGAAVLWLLGLAAVYGPASRAANIPPAIATRTA